jgi:hypothetical protein
MHARDPTTGEEGLLHERVGKADFGPVNSAIACAFDDCEDIMIPGLKKNAIERGL